MPIGFNPITVAQNGNTNPLVEAVNAPRRPALLHRNEIQGVPQEELWTTRANEQHARLLAPVRRNYFREPVRSLTGNVNVNGPRLDAVGQPAAAAARNRARYNEFQAGLIAEAASRAESQAEAAREGGLFQRGKQWYQNVCNVATGVCIAILVPLATVAALGLSRTGGKRTRRHRKKRSTRKN